MELNRTYLKLLLTRSREFPRVAFYAVIKKIFFRFCPIEQEPVVLVYKTNIMTTTEQRISILEKGQNALKALYGLGAYVNKSTIEKPLRELVSFRVSQLNGCGFCVDMHAKDARSMGETEQRLFGLSCWRETPYYSERERAALAWAEAVNGCHVTDELYADVEQYFSEQELIDLVMSISATNAWNRLNIAFATTAGTYSVGQFG